MKICFVPKDFDGPGSYRMLFPMEQLARNGHKAALPPHEIGEDGNVITNLFNEETRRVAGRERHLIQLIDADVFVFQMPLQHTMPEIALKLRALGKVVIGETDDDWINLTPDHPAYYGSAKREDYNRFHMHNTFRVCDALTVSTPQLKTVYEQVNPNVTVLPNYLNWEMWRNVTPQYEVERERVRIGWMGNATLRPRDVDVMAEFIGPFLREHPEVDFVLSGKNPGVHDQLGIPDAQRLTYPAIPFRRRTFSKDLDLHVITAVMDIGLVPLALDSPINQSKSCLKGMEYAACGIPCVASPTEQYRDWVVPGVNGFLAETPAEWREALEQLLDRVTRQRMGAEARKKAKAHSIQRHWRPWAEFYQRAVLHRAPYIPGQLFPSSAVREAATGRSALAAIAS